jgi:hypothetical protein
MQVEFGGFSKTLNIEAKQLSEMPSISFAN